MKKFLLFTMAAALALPAASYAQGTLKVGTVDMNRAFKEYNKTKDSEKKINEAKDAAKKEYDDRAENYKKALDEINKLNQQLDSPALSADKKTSMAKERDEKIANIKNMEREINEFRQTRERQLQEQAMRMRENIVKEITDVIMERVKANSYDLVFDKTGPSMNGVNVVLYAKESYDFTTDIITALNKKPVTTTTEKPATSPAEKPATTTTEKPATSPKKP
jgi:outer membrane protein